MNILVLLKLIVFVFREREDLNELICCMFMYFILILKDTCFIQCSDVYKLKGQLVGKSRKNLLFSLCTYRYFYFISGVGIDTNT